jgi:hypothetical protein
LIAEEKGDVHDGSGDTGKRIELRLSWSCTGVSRAEIIFEEESGPGACDPGRHDPSDFGGLPRVVRGIRYAPC